MTGVPRTTERAMRGVASYEADPISKPPVEVVTSAAIQTSSSIDLYRRKSTQGSEAAFPWQYSQEPERSSRDSPPRPTGSR